MGRSALEKGGNVLEGQTEMRRTIMEKLRSVKMEERGKGRRELRTVSAWGRRAVRSTAPAADQPRCQDWTKLCSALLCVPSLSLTEEQPHRSTLHWVMARRMSEELVFKGKA